MVFEHVWNYFHPKTMLVSFSLSSPFLLHFWGVGFRSWFKFLFDIILFYWTMWFTSTLAPSLSSNNWNQLETYCPQWPTNVGPPLNISLINKLNSLKTLFYIVCTNTSFLTFFLMGHPISIELTFVHVQADT